MELAFKVHIKIQKPVDEVFDAVYNPEKISKYFTTNGASAPLDGGTTVMWDFADFPGAFPVKVLECAKNERIVIEWEANDSGYDPKNPDAMKPAGYNTQVTFTFEPLENGSTQVSIGESGWRETGGGLKASYGNCFGWSQFICALKAYLEHGINLRQGAF